MKESSNKKIRIIHFGVWSVTLKDFEDWLLQEIEGEENKSQKPYQDFFYVIPEDGAFKLLKMKAPNRGEVMKRRNVGLELENMTMLDAVMLHSDVLRELGKDKLADEAIRKFKEKHNL